MKKTKRTKVILVCLPVVLIPFIYQAINSYSSASAQSSNSIAVISAITGQVQVKRVEASVYQAANVGTELYSGDLIFPAREAKVTVSCRNGTVGNIPSGVWSGINNLCSSNKTSSPAPSNWWQLIQRIIYGGSYQTPRVSVPGRSQGAGAR